MPANQPIKIAIIEDLKDVALEMQELFNEQEDLVCTQVYHSAEDAMIFLPKFPADVVIVDIGLPWASGVEAIVAIRELMPNTQFCMTTVFEDDEKIFKSLKAGAKGYILKNSSSEKILSSARELYKGGSPMNPEIARKVIDAFSAPKDDPEKANNLPLTKREYELLELLSQGLLYKEIGSQLGITTGTVKQHIHKIYNKLQVNNRTEAINRYLNRYSSNT
jgi:NarL family two-component system response regulator LiaR